MILKDRARKREVMVMMQWYDFILITKHDRLTLLASQQEEPSFPLLDVPDADVRKISSS